ncbi:HlyD family efflux transporter periplasmic adaptor subunit [Kibdelosporangium philippinense]|uniref:HlyD family efflux transporter periplasmic adaptor subunit n=1 Tax=Kibdelosporangium philippinense TaxID=211113 RepID=A0ABS8ZCU0_9PSEU|nr:HlyD family efflux transporter periplasmic adaptor subunit [Kibdelosporangium philippinense]MCE7005600.1 HlyD family efflux transporter periplasmic adaptor subunit [Kibdelosporangium philippinense]
MRRGRRAWVINGVLVVALVAAGWGAYTFLWPSSNAATPTGVRSVAATQTDVVETVSAAGNVESSYTGTADFATGGTITQINVKVGDTVTKGQQLAKLDDKQAKLQLAAAKSSLSAARENLANAGTTTSQQGQSQSTKSLQAQVDQAEVSVEQAQEVVNATTLAAPGDGTVTSVNGTVGQKSGSSSGSGSSGGGVASSSSSSSTSSGFITITNLAGLQVKANLAEIDVAKVKAGQDATVTLNALPDTPQAAKVSAIDLTATTGSNNVVTYGVTLTLNTPPAQLRPGQSASVAITVARADDVIAIPSAAMRTVGTSHTVNILANGQETSRAIEIGVRSESLVQVTSGLNVGDQVVLPTAPATTGQQERGGGGGFGGGGFGGGGGGGVRIQQPGGGGTGR